MTDVDDNKQTVVAFYARVFADKPPADAVAKYIGSEYIPFHDRQGEVVVQTASANWEPLPTRLKVGHPVPEGDAFGIINDLDTETLPVVLEPRGFWDLSSSPGVAVVGPGVSPSR